MKIFISYAHKDVAHLLAITQSLEIHEVWFDQHLSVGQTWWEEIQQQIASCHCFMILLSTHSLKSEYCQKELDVALKLNKPVVPVVVEDMELPENLRRFQAIKVTEGFTQAAVVRILNGLFEIERSVFNPLNPLSRKPGQTAKLALSDLYFATTSASKKSHYARILNIPLQTASITLEDIQHVDVQEVALHKAKQAYETLKKPLFVEQAGLAVRAWGGLPGGLTGSFIAPAGLNNLCKMLQPFEDKYAEAVSAIAFTDGQLARKFIGTVAGEIAPEPRGHGDSWNNVFIPSGFTTTLGEMTEEELLSISHRRRASVEFMRFLQSNYEIVP